MDVILLLQVTSVPFLFCLPDHCYWWAVFIYSIAFWLKLFRLKPFPGASRLCQFVLMLPKQRDAIPHEAHKEFMPCQTAIMIDVVEVKDTARFLRQQQAVSTHSTSNVAPTRGLIRLHWYSLTSPCKTLTKMRTR